MTLILPNSITNDTPADAAEVQENFGLIQSYTNANLLHRDGSVALTGPLVLPGDPTLPNQAANKEYVDQRVLKVGDTMTGMLVLPAAAPSSVNHATRKGYVDTQDDKRVAIAGDTMTGYLTLPAANPSSANHAAHKGYVDQVADAKVSVSGDTMTGALRTTSIACTSVDIEGNQPAVSFSPASGARHGYLQADNVNNRFDFNAETLTDGFRFVINDALHCTIEPSRVRTGADPFDGGSAGAAMAPSGALGALRTTDGTNLQLFKSGAAFGNGAPYAAFYGQTTATVLGLITQVGSTGVNYGESSDYRLKDDLGPIVDAAQRVMQLQPKHLRWKVDGSEFDGFIAHEAAEVVPTSVAGEKDAETDGNIEPQQLDVKKLIPLLTAALQDALTRIEALEAAA